MSTTDPAIRHADSRRRRPPQVSLGLDSNCRVLYVDKDLAGTVFSQLPGETGTSLHALFHEDCSGDCRFNVLFRKAWASLSANRASVEWEVEDDVRDGCLRLHLSRPPTAGDVAVDRRRLLALLTVTDITETRREYESVVSSNEALQRRVAELENRKRGAANEASAESDGADSPAAMRAKIIEAQEHERRRIAADLHDGVAQTLSVAKFGVESRLADLRRRIPDLDLSDFERIVDRIRDALDDLRRVSKNLSPATLSDFGLCTAIRMLCDEFSSARPDVEAVCDTCIDESALPELVTLSIYRVVQEALNNIGKHAAASRVDVSLVVAGDGVALTIADDGNGFDAPVDGGPVAGGMGLETMRGRIETSGGFFGLKSKPQQGTQILATWPGSALRLL